MGALARIVTGRRSKWLVVLAWLVLIVPFGFLGSRLADVTDNRTESVLPSDAESTEALRVQEQRFPGGESVTGLLVYRRAGALTDADRAAIAADAELAAGALPLLAPPIIPFAEGAPPELVSPAGDLAYTIVALPDDNERLPEWGTRLRDAVHEETPQGLELYVTGALGFNTDFEAVFGDIDVKVLSVTVVLVLVLLGLIYRSPLIALIPLVVVGIAYTIARGLVYLHAESGATVSDNGTSILVVLMFGVGTDYCLLLVARYREELRRHEDRHAAM
jgi:putative drug exporter of the RND superfamily